ncbi:hypothetical protein V0288_00405 [Pannus brasiliensis CCIBt3594]|uniref:Uncharacterized protein n=1 Tax=Pannus brasiliensis CCIBt3594 TaxID=1427578 RepID=A0AAW9QMW5_9CHRO
MKPIDYNTLDLDELRQYVLAHREDTRAFYTYIDRSKQAGRMIGIDLEDSRWEEKMIDRIREK